MHAQWELWCCGENCSSLTNSMWFDFLPQFGVYNLFVFSSSPWIIKAWISANHRNVVLKLFSLRLCISTVKVWKGWDTEIRVKKYHDDLKYLSLSLETKVTDWQEEQAVLKVGQPLIVLRALGVTAEQRKTVHIVLGSDRKTPCSCFRSMQDQDLLFFTSLWSFCFVSGVVLHLYYVIWCHLLIILHFVICIFVFLVSLFFSLCLL